MLLTGTVNTRNKDFTLLNNPQIRKEDYIETIWYYLKRFNYPIVFVENSSEDLSMYFTSEIENNILEILSFEGNNYSQTLGKGTGEMRCIEYGISHSKIIDQNTFVFKITGRYKVLNLHKFISFYKRHSDMELLADLTGNFKFSQSGIVGFKPFFAQKYLVKYQSILNDSAGIYFEHALAKAVLEAMSGGIRFYIFKYYPKIKAISGTTDKAYRKSFLYLIPRRFKYIIRYFILMR